MEAFFRKHSGVAREQREGEAVVLPLRVPPALEAVLARFPAAAAAPPASAVLRIPRARALRPDLFEGVADADFAPLQAVLDYYCFPVAWSEWVAQEALARTGALPLPEPLPPFMAAALAALRDALAACGIHVPPSTLDAELWLRLAADPDPGAVDYVLQLAQGARVLPPPDAPRCFACRVFASMGDLEGLKWARGAGLPWDDPIRDFHMDIPVRAWWRLRFTRSAPENSCAAAAWGGHVAVLQWMAEVGYWDGHGAHDAAVQRGHLPLVRWLAGRGCVPREDACAVAANGGHLALLQWLVDAGCSLDAVTFTAAALGGHLAALEWLAARGCPWTAEACTAAATRGHLPALQWLVARGCPWTEAVCTTAVNLGHQAVLEWAAANGCPVSERCCFDAAARGDLAALQCLVAAGALLTADVCFAAAERGHGEIVQWVASQGCPVTRRCYRAAAARGDVASLQCLVAGAGPWLGDVCLAAIEGGHVPVLQWAVATAAANGQPLSDPQLCREAALSGALAALQCLVAGGCRWDATTCAAAAFGGHLEVLRWARANGCPWDKLTCAAAVSKGHLEVLRWARAHGCPWDATQCMMDAQMRHFDALDPPSPAMVNWIRQQAPWRARAAWWLAGAAMRMACMCTRA